MGYYRSDNGWPKYVPAAERRAKAEEKIKKVQNKGVVLNPIVSKGRQIANTFWGRAWCTNLESYSDYENRLSRGRVYLRDGSVIDLQVSKGRVEAKVMGTRLYKITVEIAPMPEHRWKSLVLACSGKIDSLIELLQGKFSKAVMSLLIDRNQGLFPAPQEIRMSCSCPDRAHMCKHLAAVLYGIGTSLDDKPEWLFKLRHVDHLELISSATSNALFKKENAIGGDTIKDSELSSVFGIDMDGVGHSVVSERVEKTVSSKVNDSKKAKKPKRAKQAKQTKMPSTEKKKETKRLKRVATSNG